MIRLESLDLPPEPQDYLDRKQAELDAEPEYSERVAKATKAWDGKSGKQFNTIRTVLDRMCSGARRCCYCEDSAADEVEHIRPKNLYPEVTFSWPNYLFACGPCNVKKSNRFKIVDDLGKCVDITRLRGKDIPVEPPAEGEPVFINPRQEEPGAFMALDLLTGLFVELPDEETRDYQRAHFTIEILGLNSRDYLIAARKEALGNYIARMKEYVFEKERGAGEEDLHTYLSQMRAMAHPTVFAELIRQQDKFPKIKALFKKAPELIL